MRTTLLALGFQLLLPPTSLACDLCNAPPRPVDDDLEREHLIELTPDSLETVLASHELLVLMLYADSQAARKQLRSFAEAAAILKGMESSAILLAAMDVGTHAEVAYRLEVRARACSHDLRAPPSFVA